MTCIILSKLSITAQAVVCLLGQGAAGDLAAPQMSPWQRVLGNPLLLVAGMFALFYVMVLLPDRRRQRETAKRLSQLKKNDRVVTAGGIHAVVVSAPADSDVITLRIDESSNTRLRVNRSAIATVLSDAAVSGEPKESKESNKP